MCVELRVGGGKKDGYTLYYTALHLNNHVDVCRKLNPMCTV